MSKQFLRIPAAVMCDATLSPAARMAFGALVAVGGDRATRGEPFEAPLERLEAILGRCGWSVTRRIQELARRGHVEVQNQGCGQRNRYRLIVG